MAPVTVAVPTLPSQEAVEVVEDLDTVLESEKCSCDAGDDNPF
ncbi:hypothetical protein HNR23_005073 [Nocardiopsis mwathae]|uniref:Uncharacterized protein n=1 Tax=Nocardiopsis mwathae TaxID=1472723 RepID=A0A7W9YMQ0_9ACTN|nr:hypothetical protein [Nocardiopsis mwathae]MBB6175013.1 hypothetical protein [Nocardiopsis mwathae]